MKLLLSAFFGLVSCIAFAQDINMQNGTFTQCGGVLFDSGGASVYINYSFITGFQTLNRFYTTEINRNPNL